MGYSKQEDFFANGGGFTWLRWRYESYSDGSGWFGL